MMDKSAIETMILRLMQRFTAIGTHKNQNQLSKQTIIRMRHVINILLLVIFSFTTYLKISFVLYFLVR